MLIVVVQFLLQTSSNNIIIATEHIKMDYHKVPHTLKYCYYIKFPLQIIVKHYPSKICINIFFTNFFNIDIFIYKDYVLLCIFSQYCNNITVNLIFR